jgi:hypothetical protein
VTEVHENLRRLPEIMADDAGDAGDADGRADDGTDLTAEQLAELARCYPDAGSARTLFLRCGIAPELLPSFGNARNAVDFWLLVRAELRNGRMDGGSRRILAMSRMDFPANAVFRRPVDGPA